MNEHERFGPVCEVDAGSYRAVERDGVLIVERADSCGALRSVEWESDEQRETWERAVANGGSAQSPHFRPDEDIAPPL